MKRSPPSAVISSDFPQIFNDAYDEIQLVKKRFIAKYINYNFGVLPSTYERDLRAFAVIASATIEQCTEDLVWAQLFAIETTIATMAGTSRLAKIGATQMRLNSEPSIDKTNTLDEGKFAELTQLIQPFRKRTPIESNAFKQLTDLRHKSAHTYAAATADPKDVWGYVVHILRILRELGISYSLRARSFKRVR